MPGGFAGGGGRPAQKRCPRCDRESDDLVTARYLWITVGLALPVAFSVAALAVATGIERFPPVASFLVSAALSTPATQAVARRIAARREWKHLCPRCGFEWPFLPFVPDGVVAEKLRERLLDALRARGFGDGRPEAGESLRLEGTVDDRPVILVRRHGSSMVQLSVAVAHGGTLDDAERENVLAAGARLQRAIEDLVPRPIFESLTLGDGELRLALRALPVAERDMETLLRLLGETAPALERVRLEVHGKERRAFAKQGVPRCGYCHADITGREPDLVACERCSTVLHAGCREELGRCPVLGCGGHERARTDTR